MFALEYAPLLHSSSVSLLGLTLGWLLQYLRLGARLPVYQHLCMGLVLYEMPRFLDVDLDTVLTCLVPALMFWVVSRPTLVVLHVAAVLLFPTVRTPAIINTDTLVATVLFAQAPLPALPYSALRIISAWFAAPHVWTFTALFAGFDGEPLEVLGAVVLVAWFGDARLTLIQIAGFVEWIYYISTLRCTGTTLNVV